MRRSPLALGILAALLVLSSCQALFTTSLGTLVPALVRTTVTIPTDISNADAAALLSTTDDPTVLAGLLTTLNTQASLAGATAATKALAAEAALGASGVAGTVTAPLMTTITDALAGTAPTPATITLIINALRTSAATPGVASGLGQLADATVLTAAGLSATDKVMSALVMAASAPQMATVTDIATLSDPANAATLAAFQASPEVQLAATLLTSAAADMAASGGDASLITQLQSFLPMGF